MESVDEAVIILRSSVGACLSPVIRRSERWPGHASKAQRQCGTASADLTKATRDGQAWTRLNQAQDMATANDRIAGRAGSVDGHAERWPWRGGVSPSRTPSMRRMPTRTA